MKDEFSLFWSIYPRKIAKADARKAWEKTAAIRPEIEKIITAIKAQCKTEQWMREGGNFIPYPATWLRGERWDDETTVILPDVTNEKPWYQTATGIEKKGAELGIRPDQFEQWQQFKIAVYKAAGHAMH